jgi:hypothetical protein
MLYKIIGLHPTHIHLQTTLRNRTKLEELPWKEKHPKEHHLPFRVS